jgi:hypothetical protein
MDFMEESKKMEKEFHEEFTDEVSGLNYINIPIDNGKELRLFKSDSNSRLDVEDFNEYRLRRYYLKRTLKNRLKGRIFWYSKIPVGNGYYSNSFVKEEFKNFINKQKEKENGEQN